MRKSLVPFVAIGWSDGPFKQRKRVLSNILWALPWLKRNQLRAKGDGNTTRAGGEAFDESIRK